MDTTTTALASGPRSHADLPKLNTANRASTAPQAHNHPRLHRKHHRQQARNTIQSAVQLQSSFNFDAYKPLRRNHHAAADTPSTANSASQSHSHTPASASVSATQPGDNTTNALAPSPAPATAADLRREQARRPKRAAEVAESLEALSRDAHAATRRLDDVHYVLLEKVATLRVTVESLQALFGEVSGARAHYAAEARALDAGLQRQVAPLGGFDSQEREAEGLVSRLRKGQERVGGLQGRLETCRGRLEMWEAREREGRKKSQRWWRVCWRGLTVLVVLVIAVLVWKVSRGVGTEKIETARAKLGRGTLLDAVWKMERNKSVEGLYLAAEEPGHKGHEQEDQRWQHVLDEL